VNARPRRHTLGWYFALTFALSWTAVALVGGPDGLLGRAPPAGERLLLLLPAMLLGPVAAGLGLTALTGGRAALAELGTRARRWRVEPRWYAVALLTTPAVLGGVVLGLGAWSGQFLPAATAGADPATTVAFALAAGLAAGFLEEIGWTGFATPRLLARHGWLAAGLLVGVPWAAWHALADWVGNAAGYGALWAPRFALWLVALTAYRVLMTFVYGHTRSLLAAQLMHASFVATQVLLTPTTRTVPDELLWYGLFALGLCAVVVAVALSARPDLRGEVPQGVAQWPSS
jgi:membrane protease YdiL (CAAX protease family)